MTKDFAHTSIEKVQTHPNNGKLLVLEGVDASGKTTLCGELQKILKKKNIKYISLHFPGQDVGTLGELIYRIHHDHEKSFQVADIDPCSLQVLHVAAHIDTIKKKIIPALKMGMWVVLDRFWWSTYVYGLNSGVDKQELISLINLEKQVWRELVPDIIFHVETEAPLRKDEQDNNTWHKKRLDYQYLAEKEGKGCKIVALKTKQSQRVKDSLINIMQKAVASLMTKTSFQNLDILIPNKLKTTPVFDCYWKFACERQNVFLNRITNKPFPWTSDYIVREYKFTNAYRVLDRVSQFLIREIITKDESINISIEDRIFRIFLFKIFNKIETWKLLEKSLGNLLWSNYSFKVYDKILSEEMMRKNSIYSAAYIMASGKSFFAKESKHQNHLKLLEYMMNSGIVPRMATCKNMASLYSLLKSYPTIGPFLAYQYATDINYSEATAFSEEEFVMAGPGACDGIKKCFAEQGKFSDEDIIRYMMENQEKQFAERDLDFKNLFGRPLKLIDCQNLFCEVGKYARVSHPQIKDISGRTRIKQVFRSSGKLPYPCFPEKWGLDKEVKHFFNLILNKEDL